MGNTLQSYISIAKVFQRERETEKLFETIWKYEIRRSKFIYNLKLMWNWKHEPE